VQLHLRLRRVDGGWRSFEAVARTVSGPNHQPLVVVEAYDVSATRLSQTAERPAVQLGGPSPRAPIEGATSRMIRLTRPEPRADRASRRARRNRLGGA